MATESKADAQGWGFTDGLYRGEPMYLSRFMLPTDEEAERVAVIRMAENGGKFGYLDNAYPIGLFAEGGLTELSFSRVTVLYGGNGSGKSTLLNLIAERLELKRTAPFNTGELFDAYASRCRFETAENDEGERVQIPRGSAIITSDDVFDYMLAVRTNNAELRESIEDAKDEWRRLKFGETIKLRGLEDYDALRLQVLSRRKTLSRRGFIRREVGEEARLESNGETALAYFDSRLKNDNLYCLDEPENSLSPKLQAELVKLLSELVRYCGCQLIIATHSPLILAMNGARIYDLDARPIDIKNWWELENTRFYYEFFKKHASLFEDGE